MKNAVHACNVVENDIVEICGEIDTRTIHFLAPQNYNQPAQRKQKPVLTDTIASDNNNNNNRPVAESGTFAYPNKISIKRKTIKGLCYSNRNEQFSYTLHNPHNQQDMNLIKIEQKDIFIAEIVKPKKKRLRRKRLQKNNNLAMKWEGLCFQPEIEAKYDCNVKPSDYVQYLNNPVRDPMFCQFDATNHKHSCDEEAIYDFE